MTTTTYTINSVRQMIKDGKVVVTLGSKQSDPLADEVVNEVMNSLLDLGAISKLNRENWPDDLVVEEYGSYSVEFLD